MAPSSQTSPSGQGESIRVRGLVQGVGFRPAVWRFARECGLAGEVLNDGEGVLIRAWGCKHELDRFLRLLSNNPPTLARIDNIERNPINAICPFDDFKIVKSDKQTVRTGIIPDTATCSDCLEEILNRGRRYRYPFTNCSHCGPRLSIVSAMPYDRAHTSMAAFEICAPCQGEYSDPEDRRFHAQPIACSSCGPKVTLDMDVAPDAIGEACTLLQQGGILAIKGIGGFHLACDATNKTTVEKLRSRKQRYGKPLALMARDIKIIAQYCSLSELEKSLLQSPRAPIVLLSATGEKSLPDTVAPGMNTYGFMLPGTPLHHLLLEPMNRPLVLTSGNLVDEPQCIDNHEAYDRLKDVADHFLFHDRDIVNRVDDSVVRVMDGKPHLLRRGRGYAPDTLLLPPGFEGAPQLLALGGELKNTFCLIKNGQAFLSQHIGDLKNSLSFDDYRKNIDLYLQLFQHVPQALVVDCHPQYLSTKLGREWAEREDLDVLAVQHHHAHIASCMAENNIPLNSTPVLGVALDGLGYGEGESLWGGEFLLADYRSFKRLGSFKPIPLLGGNQAMLEPWRNILAHILTTLGWKKFMADYGDLELVKFLQAKPVNTFQVMIEKKMQCPESSSAGRLFDAVSAALGVCREKVSYEGQAAMELEAIVDETFICENEGSGYPFTITDSLDGDHPCFIDPHLMWKTLFEDLQKGIPKGMIAAKFHMGLACVITRMIKKISSQNQKGFINKVVLSGGVFQNRILLEQVALNLRKENYTVLTHSRVPANDGGVSLGQAMVAAARCMDKESKICV